MKKNLLVTLADESYLDAAKQVFSGAYFNAGWKGDYMLLAYKVPKEKLAWFRKKGILVKECEPLVDENVFGRWFSTTLISLWLFTNEFKKWNKVIYIDGDTIIRASLDDLIKVKGFAAVSEKYSFKALFIKNLKNKSQKTYYTLKSKYNLNSLIFNAGLFVFDTDIINKDTFSDLFNLLNFYGKYILSADEPILNLFFYRKWKQLPFIYNVFVNEPVRLLYKLHFIKIEGIIIHFAGEGFFSGNKPWSKENLFYKEWKFNFDRFELINLKKPYNNFIIFSDSEKIYWQNYYLKLYRFWLIEPIFNYYFIKPFYLIDNLIGHIGIFLKKNHPEIYYKLNKNKNENINY